MAIDVCSEISSAGISPRISFSHDLNQTTDAVPIEDHYLRRLDSALLDSDFEFCFGNSFVQELSSADELFSNGKILPVQIKKHVISSKDTDQLKSPISQPLRNSSETTEKKQLKEFLSMSIDADEKPASKSFWQFKRSNSLNCDSTRTKGLIRSLHFLSRSNSTGSAPSPPKQAMLSKETQKPQLRKQASVPSRRSSVPSSAAFYSYNSQQKPPLLRKCGSHGNGVRVSRVLNIPPPYISGGTVNLFGFGSLFCNVCRLKEKSSEEMIRPQGRNPTTASADYFRKVKATVLGRRSCDFSDDGDYCCRRPPINMAIASGDR